MLKLGELGELGKLIFECWKLGELGKMSFGMILAG